MKKFTDLLFKAGGSVGNTGLKTSQHSPSQSAANAFQPKQPPSQRQFPASTAHNISSCQLHDQNLFPNVKALEYCNTCQMGMCYMCAHEHFDDHHTVDWGFDVFNAMEPSRNEVND